MIFNGEPFMLAYGMCLGSIPTAIACIIGIYIDERKKEKKNG